MNWNASARALLEELRPVALNQEEPPEKIQEPAPAPELEPEPMTTALFGWS